MYWDEGVKGGILLREKFGIVAITATFVDNKSPVINNNIKCGS